MRALLVALTLVALTSLDSLPLSPNLVFAGSVESSRDRTTLTIEQNTVTVDNDVKYLGYVPGERIQVTLAYTATCSVVFSGVTLFKPMPFVPPRVVTGELANVSGTPRPGNAATTGSVTFSITFKTMESESAESTGSRSGLARLMLVLGVDQDCNLATGDPDGVDRSATIRLQIRVSTDSQ
jgi:hypothetical protein